MPSSLPPALPVNDLLSSLPPKLPVDESAINDTVSALPPPLPIAGVLPPPLPVGEPAAEGDPAAAAASLQAVQDEALRKFGPPPEQFKGNEAIFAGTFSPETTDDAVRRRKESRASFMGDVLGVDVATEKMYASEYAAGRLRFDETPEQIDAAIGTVGFSPGLLRNEARRLKQQRPVLIPPHPDPETDKIVKGIGEMGHVGGTALATAETMLPNLAINGVTKAIDLFSDKDWGSKTQAAWEHFDKYMSALDTNWAAARVVTGLQRMTIEYMLAKRFLGPLLATLGVPAAETALWAERAPATMEFALQTLRGGLREGAILGTAMAAEGGNLKEASDMFLGGWALGLPFGAANGKWLVQNLKNSVADAQDYVAARRTGKFVTKAWGEYERVRGLYEPTVTGNPLRYVRELAIDDSFVVDTSGVIEASVEATGTGKTFAENWLADMAGAGKTFGVETSGPTIAQSFHAAKDAEIVARRRASQTMFDAKTILRTVHPQEGEGVTPAPFTEAEARHAAAEASQAKQALPVVESQAKEATALFKKTYSNLVVNPLDKKGYRASSAGETYRFKPPGEAVTTEAVVNPLPSDELGTISDLELIAQSEAQSGQGAIFENVLRGGQITFPKKVLRAMARAEKLEKLTDKKPIDISGADEAVTLQGLTGVEIAAPVVEGAVPAREVISFRTVRGGVYDIGSTGNTYRQNVQSGVEEASASTRYMTHQQLSQFSIIHNHEGPGNPQVGVLFKDAADAPSEGLYPVELMNDGTYRAGFPIDTVVRSSVDPLASAEAVAQTVPNDFSRAVTVSLFDTFRLWESALQETTSLAASLTNTGSLVGTAIKKQNAIGAMFYGLTQDGRKLFGLGGKESKALLQIIDNAQALKNGLHGRAASPFIKVLTQYQKATGSRDMEWLREAAEGKYKGVLTPRQKDVLAAWTSARGEYAEYLKQNPNAELLKDYFPRKLNDELFKQIRSGSGEMRNDFLKWLDAEYGSKATAKLKELSALYRDNFSPSRLKAVSYADFRRVLPEVPARFLEQADVTALDYLDAVSTRIGWAHSEGGALGWTDFKPAQVTALLETIGERNFTLRSALVDTWDVVTGTHQMARSWHHWALNYGPLSKFLRGFTLATKLGLTTVYQPVQMGLTVARHGIPSSLKGFRQFFLGHNKSVREAQISGAVTAGSMRDFMNAYLMGDAGDKVVSGILRAEFFTPLELNNQILTSNIAKFHLFTVAEHLQNPGGEATQLLRTIYGENIKQLNRDLSRRGFTPGEIIALSTPGTEITPTMFTKFMASSVEEAQFARPSILSTPYYMYHFPLISQFQRFAYMSGRFSLESVRKLMEGNVHDITLQLGVTLPMTHQVRAGLLWLQGRSIDDEGFWTSVQKDLFASGMLGRFGMLYTAMDQGRLLETTIGPGLTTLLHFAQSLAGWDKYAGIKSADAAGYWEWFKTDLARLDEFGRSEVSLYRMLTDVIKSHATADITHKLRINVRDIMKSLMPEALDLEETERVKRISTPENWHLSNYMDSLSGDKDYTGSKRTISDVPTELLQALAFRMQNAKDNTLSGAFLWASDRIINSAAEVLPFTPHYDKETGQTKPLWEHLWPKLNNDQQKILMVYRSLIEERAKLADAYANNMYRGLRKRKFDMDRSYTYEQMYEVLRPSLEFEYNPKFKRQQDIIDHGFAETERAEKIYQKHRKETK